METGSPNRPIRVMVDLSNCVICEALKRLLDHFPTFATISCHDTETRSDFAPDVVLRDVKALEKQSLWKWDAAKTVLMDTGLKDNEIISLLMSHKLHGVISADMGPELFVKALQTVHGGELWIEHATIKMLLHHPSQQQIKPKERFTKREREIMLLIAHGRTNRQIASDLNVSEQTVKSHLGRIFRKADVRHRAQLAHVALKLEELR